MPAPGPILREIHRLRKFAKELEGKLDQGPKAHKAHQLKIAQAEEALHKAQDGVKHLKVKILEKEGLVKGMQQNIEKLEKTPISNKKEYDALRAEINTVRDAIRKLEDQILDAMAELEDKTRSAPEAEKALEKAKAEAAQFEKDYQDKLSRWAEERKSAVQQVAEVEAGLPDELKAQYTRLIALKKEDALAPVQNKICIACYTEVTPQMSNELNRGLTALCKNCGRMLYVVE